MRTIPPSFSITLLCHDNIHPTYLHQFRFLYLSLSVSLSLFLLSIFHSHRAARVHGSYLRLSRGVAVSRVTRRPTTTTATERVIAGVGFYKLLYTLWLYWRNACKTVIYKLYLLSAIQPSRPERTAGYTAATAHGEETSVA